MVALTALLLWHHPQVSQSQEGRGGKRDKCMFLLYIDASSITNGKGRGAGADSASVGIEFSLKDYYCIQVRLQQFVLTQLDTLFIQLAFFHM